jgi:hypothetical protein
MTRPWLLEGREIVSHPHGWLSPEVERKTFVVKYTSVGGAAPA